MRQVSIRLHPGQLLKEEIERIAKEEQIKAGVIMSIVGGLKHASLRMAGSVPDKKVHREIDGPFEIVAGTGTVSMDGSHIHLAISDVHGNVIGGHLRPGSVIEFTVELVILSFNDVTYHREMDEETGFKELVVDAG